MGRLAEFSPWENIYKLASGEYDEENTYILYDVLNYWYTK